MKKKYSDSVLGLIIEFAFILIGAVVSAFALECFLIPNSILDGGINGVSIILHKIFNINLSVLIIIINIPFIYIGYKNLGFKFLVKAIVSIAIFSLFLEVFKNTKEVTDNILLATVYGSALLGLGVGVIIRYGGCLDGTESLGIVISKNTNLSVGQFVLFCNVVIFGVSGIFFGIDRALFSLLAYFITSKIVDEISEGFEKAKAAMIITDEGETLANQIYKKIGRTVTKIKGKGLISGEKEILYCVITRIELSELKKIVLEADTSAFITITDVSEIIGSHIKNNKGMKKKKIVTKDNE